jgi:hypothetical protein
MNYSCTPHHDQWLLENDPDRQTCAALAARLDAVIAAAERPQPLVSLTISPMEAVHLAEMSDAVPFNQTTAYAQLRAQRENMQRDQMRCDAIRAQKYVARKREEQSKAVRGSRILLGYLATLAAIVVVVWLAVTHG